jgi:hypothetical protein
MIPVKPQPEPERFAERVRAPGMQFLEQVPRPTSEQWGKRAYWQRALPDMRAAYDGICAYSAHWIPHSTGNHSIDHFVPKSASPNLAYEWTNFRYVSARFNSRKGTRTILDPFELQPDWFVIDLTSFLIKPHSSLSPGQQKSVWQTIECLKLNTDDDLVDERASLVNDYRDGGISFSHLRKIAPFIAYELKRQGLLDHTDRDQGKNAD